MSNATKTCRDIGELHPAAQKACRLFLQECEKAGLDVCITETYRSQERQEYLYAQGRTRAGNVVTWTRYSRHTSRLAWDICKNAKGQEYSDAGFFTKCGTIAKQLGITWGGTWKTPDKPHFEVTKEWTCKEEEEMIEKDTIIVDGKKHQVDMIRKDGVTFVKTRDIAEALGLKVSSQGKVPVLTRE